MTISVIKYARLQVIPLSVSIVEDSMRHKSMLVSGSSTMVVAAKKQRTTNNVHLLNMMEAVKF
jgi:hypothetical protein